MLAISKRIEPEENASGKIFFTRLISVCEIELYVLIKLSRTARSSLIRAIVELNSSFSTRRRTLPLPQGGGPHPRRRNRSSRHKHRNDSLHIILLYRRLMTDP